MTTATLTSKGQITIPSLVRAELNVGPGDRVEFVKIADNRFEVVAATKDITQIRGMISTNHTVSIDEMNAAIRKKASSR